MRDAVSARRVKSLARMQTIDRDQLDNVTGGGNFLAGLQQVLGFFQSPGFQQMLGGLQSILGGFAQLGQGTAAPAPGADAAPSAGSAQPAPAAQPQG